jgi:hypothetical protein
METKYDLKRLKLLGMVLTVMLTVLLLNPFKAEAQITGVTITGPTEVCLGPSSSALSTYTAVPTGTASGTLSYSWTWSGAYGVPQSGISAGSFGMQWNDPTCETGTPTQANWAWVYVTVTENPPGGVAGTFISGPYYVNIYEDLPAPAAIGPFYACETATSIPVTGNDPSCSLVVGQWKNVPPGALVFDDPYDFTTTIDGPLAPGVYTMTWNLNNGLICGASTVTTTLTVYEMPEVSIAAVGATEKCFGGSVTLTATITNAGDPFTLPVTYQWYKGATAIASATSASYTALSTGVYSVQVTTTGNATCGPVGSNTITVTISELESVAISTLAKTAWCANETVSVPMTAALTGTPVNPVTYQWYQGATPVGTNAASYTATAAGVYTVKVTDQFGAATCTYTSNSITVVVNPLPSFAISAPDVCVGNNVLVTVGTVTNGPAVSAAWTVNGTPAPAGTTSGLTVTAPAVGVYTVVATLTNGNGCSGTATTTFEVFPLPAFDIVGTATVCFNSTAVLSLANQANFCDNLAPSWDNVVSWWVDGTPAGTFTDVYTFTFDPADWGTVTVTSSHVVTAQVTNCNGCVSVVETFNITILGQPYITKNEILPPRYINGIPNLAGVPKTVWCTVIPAGGVIYGVDDVEWAPIPPNELCDVEYRWLKSIDGGTTWISTGFGADFNRDYTLPMLEQTTWYKRQARLLDCTCPTYDPVWPTWHDSNIIKMIILPATHFDFDVTASADVCLGDPDGIYVTASNGGTFLPLYAAGGMWTVEGPGTLTMTSTTSPSINVKASVAGEYTLTYTVTEESYVQSCGGPTHAESVTITFETIAITNAGTLGLPAQVCFDAAVIGLVTPTVTAVPSGNVASIGFSGPGVVGSTFNPALAGVGTHTITFTAVSDAGCTSYAYAVIEVLALPAAPSTTPVVACYDATAKSFSVGAAPAGFALWYKEGAGAWTLAPLPTKTAVGTYTVSVKYIRIAAPNCEGPVSTASLTINHTPVVTIGAIANPFWDDNMTITATHASMTPPALPATYVVNATYVLNVVGTMGSYTWTSPSVASFSHEFDTQVLGVGTATATLTATYAGTGCVSAVATKVFQVLPPYYAMFSPTYETERSVEHATDPIPADYFVANVDINHPLTVTFNREVRTANNLVLPLSDLGEFVLLQKWNGTTWVNVPFTSTRSGNAITLIKGSALDYASFYRIGYNNVYRPMPTGNVPGPAVVYTLDAESVNPVVFNENMTTAYELDQLVYFRTISECNATIPSVFPTGDDVSICSNSGQIVVNFVNPVRYLSGVHIATGDSPHHKFRLQRLAGSSWIDVPFTAVASNFATAANGSGPKTITLNQAPNQFNYCTEYRVVMNQYNPAGGTPEYDFGFIDLETGCNVLGREHGMIVPDNSTYLLAQDWTWTTTCEYDLMVDVAPWPGDEFGTRPNNVNNVTVGSFGNLITYPALVPGPGLDKVKKTTPYVISNPGSTFTMAATNGEGYNFTNWSRSTDGGATFTNLPTTGTISQVNGVDYFAQSFPFAPATLAPNCGQNIVYKANFTKNTYTVTVAAYNSTGSTLQPTWGTVTGGGAGKVHGTTVTLTATPKAGYYFVGWEYDLPGTITATQSVYPPLHEIMDPTAHTATLDLMLFGPLTNGATFPVKAKFGIFQPYIYAAAQGLNYSGNQVPNITEVEFTTLYVSNILQTGIEAAGVFTPDGANFYEWAKFVYGNPDYSLVHAPVTVEPLDVPCEYRFVKWERWNPVTDVWFQVSTNMVYSFIPTQNYRLRAVFEWKTDIMVSVDNDVTVVTDPMAMASILVEEGTNSWYNSPSAKPFSPSEVLTITVIPEPGYFTYGFVTPAGTPIPLYNPSNPSAGGMVKNSEYPERIAGSNGDEDRTVWQYVVGCNPVDLRAVVGKIRYNASASVTPQSPVIGGDVRTSIPASPYTPAYGYGYWPEDVATGFVDNNTTKGTAGWFDLGTNVTFKAVASPNTATQIWEFLGWYNGAQLVSTALDYNMNVVGHIALEARFINTYSPPKWNVTATGTPDASYMPFTYSPAGPYLPGTSVTVTANAQPGWKFKSWATADITLTVPQTTANPLTITTPTPGKHVNLVATFEKIDVTLNLAKRTYLRTENNGTFPYTDGMPYVIGEELPAPITGGTVVDITGTSPYNFDENVTLLITPYPGFRLINVMVGTEVGSNNVFQGMQVNPASGYTVFPNNYSFVYTVPAQYASSLTVTTIFGEATAPNYPAYQLVTNTSPAGFGTTTGDGNYAHSVVAKITEEVTQPGYHFDRWELKRANVNANSLLTGGQYASDNYVNVLGTAAGQVFSATAHYEATEYSLHVMAAPMGYGLVDIGGTTEPDYMYTTDYTVEDDIIYLTATANDWDDCYEYEFVGWTYDALGNEPVVYANGDATFGFIPVVPEAYMSDNGSFDVTIYAQFVRVEQEFSLTLETAFNTFANLNPNVGTISTTLSGPYMCASAPYQMTISAAPAVGYKFKHFTNGAGTVIVTVPQFEFTMTDDAHFIAVFEALPITVTTATDPASLGGTTGGGTYIIGNTVALNAVAHTGYTFNGWYEGAAMISNMMAYNVVNIPYVTPRNFVAKYTINSYAVAATAQTGGTVAVTPATALINYNTPVSVSYTMLPGYTFAGWIATGVDITGMTMANPLTFNMPDNGVTVQATFTAIPYTVSVASAPLNGGTFSALAASYTVGQNVSVTATANTGFVFGSWTGAPAGATVTGNVISFAMPAGNVSLTGNFTAAGNSLTGSVKYFNQFETMMPVAPNFTVGLYNGASLVGTSTLDGTGKYMFTGIQPGVDYTVKVMQSGISTPFGGVSSVDALIANYMTIESPILANTPWIDPTGATPPVYTPYSKKVADVNTSGTVSALDALTIQLRTVNNITSYPGTPDFQVAAAEVASFTAKTYPQAPTHVFSFSAGEYAGTWTGKAGQTIMNIYFTASGDLNASYVPQSAKAKVNLNYNGQISANVGDVVNIPLSIGSGAQLGALTLGLTFDNSLLEVTGVEGFSGVNKVDNANGTIRISWMDLNAKNVSANENIVIITAKVLAAIDADTRYFELDEAEFADRTATPIDGITLTTKSITGGPSVLEAGDLISSAYPNPFKDMATINFTLPEAGKVTIVVYNKFGQEVSTLVNENREAGVQYNVELNSYDLSGSGTYFYRILVEGNAKSYTANGTLILVK